MHECPVQLFGQMQTVFMTAKRLRNGIMPRGGGWEEQPAFTLEAAEIVNAEVDKVMEDMWEQNRER